VGQLKSRVANKYVDLINPKIGPWMHQVVEASDTLKLPSSLSLEFCEFRLLNAVVSYLYDKERHKDFHGSEEPSDAKKAALLCRWIAKVRPFSVKRVDPTVARTKEDFFYANLINAIVCIRLYQAIAKKTGNGFVVDTTLLYELHYGQPTNNMLIVAFENGR
jgi:hypothetical protein